MRRLAIILFAALAGCGPAGPLSIGFGGPDADPRWASSEIAPRYRRPTYTSIVITGPAAAAQEPALRAAITQALVDKGIRVIPSARPDDVPRLRVVVESWPAGLTAGEAMTLTSAPRAHLGLELHADDGSRQLAAELEVPIFGGTHGEQDSIERAARAIATAVAEGRAK